MGHRADNTSKGNRWDKISTLSFYISHVFRFLSLFTVSFSSCTDCFFCLCFFICSLFADVL